MLHAHDDDEDGDDQEDFDDDEGGLNGDSRVFDEPDEDDDLDEDDEEDDEMTTTQGGGAALPQDREPARSKGGERTDDDMAADRLAKGEKREVETGVHPHQDELLDEGLEESFPASDPVSVKRIT